MSVLPLSEPFFLYNILIDGREFFLEGFPDGRCTWEDVAMSGNVSRHSATSRTAETVKTKISKGLEKQSGDEECNCHCYLTKVRERRKEKGPIMRRYLRNAPRRGLSRIVIQASIKSSNMW
jgi:hypothetical protein